MSRTAVPTRPTDTPADSLGPTRAAATPRPGRWVIDPHRSDLRVGVKVGGLVPVQGRFAELAGTVELTADPERTQISARVATASLTSGSSHWDAVLTHAGLVDVRTNPQIAFTSTALRAGSATGWAARRWELDGTLLTGRGTLAVRFALCCTEASTERITLRATGSVGSRDAVRLLSQPGFEKLIGRSMAVDLAIEAAPAA
ncbi:YceI family protein [Nakamurella leprariae]|uniref:YceI family protein n=1 Tax=Nakamurella leprariae TaxID=2803911 RepID=A0A938Y8W6_9ACTN|nr:YceI family protein [Nakamurella leprariae]MBM9466127.1 YceI family protein [Nakamurella leprariae]